MARRERRYESVDAALADGKTQDEIDSYLAEHKRNIMILFGPPGRARHARAQDRRRARHPAAEHGDMLRAAAAAGTDVGKQAKRMEAGGLVSDDPVVGVIAVVRWTRPTPKGDPRRLPAHGRAGEQARRDAQGDGREGQLRRRARGARRGADGAHHGTKRPGPYHVTNKPPKSLGDKAPTVETMLDDETGEALMQRADDTRRRSRSGSRATTRRRCRSSSTTARRASCRRSTRTWTWTACGRRSRR